jgi:PAS domain S-box-containing protein
MDRDDHPEQAPRREQESCLRPQISFGTEKPVSAGVHPDLRRALNRLHVHEETTPLAIVECDTSSRIIAWSTRAAELTGTSADEAMGRQIESLNLFVDDDWTVLEKCLLDLRDGRATTSMSSVRMCDRNGRLLHTEWYNATLDEIGRRTIISFILDDSERVRADEAHRRLEERQWRFVRDVLSSVTGGRLNLCADDTDLPERLEPISEWIDLNGGDSVHRLRAAVRDASRRAQIPDERAFDFEVAVGEAAANAIRHARDGKAQICTDGESRVQAWVSDQGGGIRLDNLPRATLERGYTTAQSLGHGFWIILKMADRIWLETDEGGTTLVIEQDRALPEPEWSDASLANLTA